MVSFSVAGQTAGNLQAKFGAPTKTFEVNSNVTLSVEFGEDGQACQMTITERQGFAAGNVAGQSVQSTADDTLNEVMPEAKRGKRLQSAGSVGNCFSLRTEEYEKVTITSHSQLCVSPPSVKKTIQILWKRKQCQGGELVVDTRLQSARTVTPFASSLGLLKPITADQKPQPLLCPNTEETDYVEYKRIYRKYEVSQNAEILEIPQPELTPEAIAEKTTGKMTIEGILHPCGGAVTSLVMRGYVRNGLAERATVAFRKIKYKPAMDKGRPVAQRIYLEYNFYLCGKAPICTSVKEVVQ